MKIRQFLFWCLISLFSGLGALEHCSPLDKENVLQINNAYTYHFRSVALAQAVGTTEDQGKVVLECEVRISHDRMCYYTLELQDCVTTASGGEPGFESPWMDRKPLPDLSRHHVTFSLVNGEIKEVKTHEDDPLHYVNIKRGVLSAFVFKLSQTVKEVDEMHRDIHGTCPLKSVPGKDADGEVKTSKDMLNCQFPSRPDWQFSPWSIFWNMSFIQHVINSTTNCSYQVSTAEKRIEKVFCHERHAIMLESTHSTTTAVQTNVFYYMDFIKSEVQNSKRVFAELTRTTDIQYEYEDTAVPETSPQNFLEMAIKMLSDLVLDSVDEIRLFTIPQFTDFVAWIRASHDLTTLVDKVNHCEFVPDGAPCDDRIKELALSYLSDALVQCNSLPCAKAIAYLAKNDDLSPTYLNFVFQTWSYMHYSKPGFLTNFVSICQSKDSRQCWMSVGSFARRIYSRDNYLNEKVLEEVKDLANYFHGRIEEDCEVTDDADNSQYTNCLVFLKAASNLGKSYSTLVTGGVSRFLEHATNDHSPTFVRTSALEAIQEVYDPDNKEQHREIFDEILPLLKNSSLPASVRILSYDQLMLVVSEEYHFEEDLLGILKEEKNADVKFYVADSLNSLLVDRQFRDKQEKFLNSLTELLQENHLSLEVILYETKSKSKSRTSSHSGFFNFPFHSDSMKKFGLKVSESRLFDSHIYPTVLNQKTIMQLFSTFVQTSKLGSYFEGWEEILLAYQKNVADMDSKSASLSKILNAVVQTLEGYGSEDGESMRNYDGNVIENVKKLHELYWQHHNKLKPYAKAYLDLFGSTIKYMVQDSFHQSSSNRDLAKTIRFLWKDLEDGVTYNTTRVIRVIEAYHQVPTMMGLPLNWTTNATLAISVRAGLKYQLNIAENQIHSKGFFQPSVALTFLNRMVLDFPTLTQIGVQANSSGYTSTHVKLQYNSSKGKQTLRLERPLRTQKILELFRTNQLIKHNSYNDIADWDIERTSSSWCTSESTNSVAGLKFCLSKSYPNVTHRMKPWALMAGWCKWQFLVHPLDQNDVHYDIELQQTPKQKSKEYTAKFSVTGKEKEKAAYFMAVTGEDAKDMKIELKTSLLPDFYTSITRSDITRNQKVSGQKIEARLNLFKDFKYEMEYTKESKIQKPKGSTIKGGATSDDENQILILEEKFSLATPYSFYKGNKTVKKVGENTKAEASLQYENLNSRRNWLRMMLPPAFWENEKKASVNVLLHWKKPMHKSDDTVTRQTEFRLTVPHYTMTLLGDSLKTSKREQINVNLAKMNNKYRKLETFLNLTYDSRRNEDEDDPLKFISQVNLTVPRRSWSLMYQSAKDVQIPSGDKTYKYEVKLRRIWMKPKHEDQRNYVGWWSSEVSDRFTLDEKEVKLNVDLQMPELTNEELNDKYFAAMGDEDQNDFTSSVTVAKVALHYPLFDRVESILLDGYLFVSSGSRVSRFQKTFDLISSYNNLQLTSNSVYKSGIDSTILYHHSYFTHLPSQTKAYHTIHYTKNDPYGGCRQIAFKHDIRSHVFDLSTNATYNCVPENEDLNILLLKINTNSSKWNMLDMTLDQVVQDVSPEFRREEVTVTHPLGTLHVDAEWHGKKHVGRDHQKRVVVCSKEGNCPNAEFFLDIFHDGRTNMKFILPNQNNSQITYERKIFSDHKNLHIKLGHSDKESNLTDFLDFTGEIVSENFQVWKIMLDVKTFAKVKEQFLEAYESASNIVLAVAKNATHPLNEILRPALKLTMYDYWNSVKIQAKEFWSVTWLEVKEVVCTLETFTQTAYTLFCNFGTVVNDLFRTTYNAVKDKSVTIWAITYFDLPYYFQQSFMYLPHGISELVKQLALQEDGVLNFKLVTGRIISLGSFTDWPSIFFYPTWLKNIINRETEDLVHSHLDKGEKLGMIFGPLHIYTFDGYLYDVPEYPHKDCSFLLAHDVHKSLFTVFSSKKGIHILFPEMSVTVDDQNEVFINGSRSPSSLPIQAGNGKVTVKRGERVVEVWSPSLSVICSDRHFLCLLKLRKFHSGGVIGLLGNGDEYEDNEFMLPNGNTTSSLLEYASSYEISGKSECKNLALNPNPSAADEDRTMCSYAFSDVCYSRYNVREQFFRACLSDIKAGHDLCYAAAGLTALCHFQYTPSHTGCNTKKQESENIKANLEVVLVVQESKYLTSPDAASAPLKGIESLVRSIDTKFKESGYGRVQFSLVGFGGNGVHYAPTVHTAGKEIWLPAEEMIKDVLKTLQFKSKEDADAMFALKYALDELGYDSFDSKVVIVVTMKDRQVTEKFLIDSINRHLNENGITLYTLSSYPSIEKGKKVFGVRTDGLIFPSQTKGGDAYMDYPRGSLAKLTSSTRGSLFLNKFLRDNKPAAFFTEFAQEVWAKVNKEAEKCRSCKDVKSGWWWYRKECAIVHC